MKKDREKRRPTQNYKTKICVDVELKKELLTLIETSFAGEIVEAYTYPGVFSCRKTDPGTILLAENLPQTGIGKILDVGCGSGILSILASRIHPAAEIHAVDIDPRAVALSQLNFETFGTTGQGSLTAWASNLFDQVIDRDYDLVLSNIPAKASKEVHQDFIDETYTHLRDGGWVYIVAAGRLQKYLKRLLEEKFGNCEKIARNKTHTVVAAGKKS